MLKSFFGTSGTSLPPFVLSVGVDAREGCRVCIWGCKMALTGDDRYPVQTLGMGRTGRSTPSVHSGESAVGDRPNCPSPVSDYSRARPVPGRRDSR